jgi:hypothetical protein
VSQVLKFHGYSSLFSLSPAGGTLGSAGLKKEKKAPGDKLPALTPILSGVEFGPNMQSKFEKSRQLFIDAHNGTLSAKK